MINLKISLTFIVDNFEGLPGPVGIVNLEGRLNANCVKVKSLVSTSCQPTLKAYTTDRSILIKLSEIKFGFHM